MGPITKRIDAKIKQIKEMGGTPSFINAGLTTEHELREEWDSSEEMAGNGGTTISSVPDEHPFICRGLKVLEAHGEARDFLSVTYVNAQGEQKEL